MRREKSGERRRTCTYNFYIKVAVVYTYIYTWVIAAVLCCTVLHCTIMHCTVHYCIVLYHTVLCCTVCIVLYCTVLCFIVFCVGASKGPPVLYSSYSTEHQRIVLYAYLQKQLIIIIFFYNNRLCRQWLTSDQYAASQWRSQKPETRQGTTRAHVPFIIIYPYIFPSFYCHVRQSKTIQYLYYSL